MMLTNEVILDHVIVVAGSFDYVTSSIPCLCVTSEIKLDYEIL